MPGGHLRRENLKHSTDELRVQLEDAKAALGEAFEGSRRSRCSMSAIGSAKRPRRMRAVKGELDRIAAMRFNAGGAPA
jgi:hypothetical protein